MPSWLPSVGLTVLPQVGGILGGLITKSQIKNWYDVSKGRSKNHKSLEISQTLNTVKVKVDKPSWRPPNWLFGPVWTGLYTVNFDHIMWRISKCQNTKVLNWRLWATHRGWYIATLSVQSAIWRWVFMQLSWVSTGCGHRFSFIITNLAWYDFDFLIDYLLISKTYSYFN